MKFYQKSVDLEIFDLDYKNLEIFRGLRSQKGEIQVIF